MGACFGCGGASEREATADEAATAVVLLAGSCSDFDSVETGSVDDEFRDAVLSRLAAATDCEGVVPGKNNLLKTLTNTNPHKAPAAPTKIGFEAMRNVLDGADVGDGEATTSAFAAAAVRNGPG
ncbi:MAG: hypothetical protein R3C05_16200 [Pirellulaceae bacterium]